MEFRLREESSPLTTTYTSQVPTTFLVYESIIFVVRNLTHPQLLPCKVEVGLKDACKIEGGNCDIDRDNDSKPRATTHSLQGSGHRRLPVGMPSACWCYSLRFTCQPPLCLFTRSTPGMNTPTVFSICITCLFPYKLTSNHLTTSTAIKAVDDNQYN